MFNSSATALRVERTSNRLETPRAAVRAVDAAAPAALAAPFVELLATLHGQAGIVELGQFRSRALQELLESFDGCEAFWITGIAREAAVHTVTHVARGRSSPSPDHDAGAVGVATAWLTTPELSTRSIAVRIIEPGSGLTTGVVIRRDAARPGFGSQDLASLRRVVPHLLLAWRTCQTLKLYRRAATASGRATAIVDRFGHLHVADPQFLGALRRCWPGWTGPRVPASLSGLLAGGTPMVVADLQWSATAEGDLMFVSAAAIGVLARLTGRERQAAVALLAGGSYAECARQLGISSNTARNTIARVYRKLGIGGKLELAQRVGVGAPQGAQ